MEMSQTDSSASIPLKPNSQRRDWEDTETVPFRALCPSNLCAKSTGVEFADVPDCASAVARWEHY